MVVNKEMNMPLMNKLALVSVVVAVSLPAWALNEGTHLNPRGQSKVDRTLAKGYLQSGTDAMQKQKTQVNIGSKRDGTCNMNVGASPGSQGSKETIVTAKEIINVCK